jgi:hypothetical protein
MLLIIVGSNNDLSIAHLLFGLEGKRQLAPSLGWLALRLLAIDSLVDWEFLTPMAAAGKPGFPGWLEKQAESSHRASLVSGWWCDRLEELRIREERRF